MAEAPVVDLAIVGAGVGGCALAAQLRRLGWSGTLRLLEIGRGPGGRAATRRSRNDPGLRIDHGAPLFNLRDSGHPPPALLNPLLAGGWIESWPGAVGCIDGEGRIGAAIHDGFSDGSLYRGRGGMEQLGHGLLRLAGSPELWCNSLVRQLQPLPAGGWRLLGATGEALLCCRWLVLSGSLLAHPRCQAVFGWSQVPLQTAAAELNDPALQQACDALAQLDSNASSNLLLALPAEVAAAWQGQPFQLLQFSPEAQDRWGLRRVSIQPLGDGRCAVVAESSAAFARRAIGIYGSRSSAAQQLGARPDPVAEQAVLDGLDQALQEALGLSTAGADRQLMRWGAAFPQPPGLPAALSLCAGSRIGFCGDYLAGPGFGRIEGALRSAEALAADLLHRL
jgi:predicted NAD/FAD-dependent oxidoreductase